MALVQVSNIIVPEVFADYMSMDTTEKSALFTSGIVVPDAALAAKLSGGGETFNVPFWNDLSNTAANQATDATGDVASPLNITASKARARRQFRTQGWSDADLTREMAGSDPMTRIRSRVGAYWNREFQRALIKTLTGIFIDNTSNDAADMTYDISANTGAASEISADAILETAQTMGDNSDGLAAIIMHSRVN